ncbi:MAG: sensor domain-containing diguanylate cyclase [Succinivibrionaceae bacterium]|nr:sensor domain-containing diguanylate cyclase [Succinivibrionaceae bacterium]
MSIYHSKTKHALTLLVLVISFCVSSFYVSRMNSSTSEDSRNRAQLLAQSYAIRLDNELRSYSGVNLIWQALINRHSGFVYNFDRICHNLAEDMPELSSIAIAPEGVVTYHYPQGGNHNWRLNLFNDATEAPKARMARDQRRQVSDGPVDLGGGVQGMELLCPILLDTGKRKPDFWGLSQIRFKLADLVKALNFSDLDKAGYYYQIWIDGPTGAPEERRYIVSSASGVGLTDPVVTDFTITASKWHLGVAPKTGWVPPHDYIAELFSVTVLSLLLAGLTFLFFSIQERGERLSYLSYLDKLTGIYNLRKYLEVLRGYDSRKDSYGIMFIDLNGFKQINDTHGHSAGDVLLRTVADRMQNAVKSTDICFRFGGDEFAIIVGGETPSDALEKITERLKSHIEQPVAISQGVSTVPSISVGYARYPQDGSCSREVTNAADNMMYENKRAYHAVHGQGRGAGHA